MYSNMQKQSAGKCAGKKQQKKNVTKICDQNVIHVRHDSNMCGFLLYIMELWTLKAVHVCPNVLIAINIYIYT